MSRIHVFLLTVALSGSLIPGAAQAQIISEFMAINRNTLVDGYGESSDWIEIQNTAGSAVTLNDWYLTDDPTDVTKWQFPDAATVDLTLQPGEFLVIIASGNGDDENLVDHIDSLSYIHTNFKLDGDGESLILLQPDGQTAADAIINFPDQREDFSYGVGSDAVTGHLVTPTPGSANSATFLGFVADTKFSTDRGFYEAPFDVEITTATTGATIRYTLNGSDPTLSNGEDYTDPISITGTTTLRAAAFADGYVAANIDTQTYLFIDDIATQSAGGSRPTAEWPSPTTTNQPPPPGGGDQAINYGMDPGVTNDPRYADLVDDALLAIPTISLVTDLDNLFDDSTGIYMNAMEDGVAWERPTSVELINPDGSEGFQIDAGIRIRGGMSRQPRCPKHSFRLFFRSDYGDANLDYPLFGDEGVDEFDKLDLRTGQNFSWHLNDPESSTWLYDIFTRDSHRDMGQPHTRGFFCHLYINGEYWGLYQTEERPDANFGESYLGGDDDDYDTIKSGDTQGRIEATDGTLDAYYDLWTAINAGMTSNADYFEVQGMNPDGTINPAYTRLLDAENLIDYMIIIFFGGNRDSPLGPPGGDRQPRNLFAVFNRATPDGFQFITHDSEHTLGFHLSQGVNFNRTSVSLSSSLGLQINCNPWWIHRELIAENAEYRLQFADHVHRHFFNGGALTADAAAARFAARRAEMDLAVIAESARWGDYLNSNSPRTREDDWYPAVNAIRDDYLLATPQARTEVVFDQIVAMGWYPSVDPPAFSQHGGDIAAGFDLTITASEGTIYYTLDGSDPREIGGAVAGEAQQISSGASVTLSSSTTVNARALQSGEWSALTEAEFTVPSGVYDFDDLLDHLLGHITIPDDDQHQVDFRDDGVLDAADIVMFFNTPTE